MTGVSEYQYYEFLAIDRPLTVTERAELRELSTRAEITATRFTNEYQWGDFKGDPATMMGRYFDAHLYFANWGTRRLVLRVPRAALDTETAQQYVYAEDVASLSETEEHLIIDLYADRDPDDFWDETPELSSMVEARSGLMAGDMRLLYLAWLFAVQCGEIDDDDTEPPVPAGLGQLSASLDAIVDFLEIDEDLIDIAMERSPGQDIPAPRTVKDLMDATDAYKAEVAKAVEEHRRVEAARLEVEKAAAYAKHLDDLSAREASAWLRAVDLIETRNPGNYDQAVTLLRDLRALAERGGKPSAFTDRFLDLRRQHQRKPSLMERFDAAGLPKHHHDNQ
jgi:hypothetical protein